MYIFLGLLTHAFSHVFTEQATHHFTANELLKSIPSPEKSGSARLSFDWRDCDQGLSLDVSNQCPLFFIFVKAKQCVTVCRKTRVQEWRASLSKNCLAKDKY
jgi:hypothetical protein